LILFVVDFMLFANSLFLAALSVLIVAALGWSPAECPPSPLCDSRNASYQQQMWCRLGKDPISRDSQDYIRMVEDRLSYFLKRNLLGQDHLVPRILADVVYKLRRPNEPLILHFAGDNGVGKTSTAQLISVAMSFRCHKSDAGYYCGMGEGALSLSGTNYHGISVEDFRKSIVPQVLAFAALHPRGVVIFNDMTQLSPAHANVLLPLLGRSKHFPEDRDNSVDLHRLMVIVTTDFGKQGRTRGKSIEEVQQMVEQEVRGTFGALAGSYLRTYAFIPTTLPAVWDIVRLTFYDWACSEKLNSLVVTAGALGVVVDDCIGRVASENGRAVVEHMAVQLVVLEHNVGRSLRGLNATVAERNGVMEMHVDSAASDDVSDL
jgi:DNA polymerase III delta prime subunit